MASLVLSAGGAAAGGALFGQAGAVGGRLAGALAGNLLDHALFGAGGGSVRTRALEGPRLAALDIMASSEGAPIPRAYGRVRLSGQVIWATRLQEVISTRSESTGGGGGGKGGGGGGGAAAAPATVTTTTAYSYFANFAVGLCEGPIGQVLRAWADGKPLDLATVTMRVHRGGGDQEPDPLIVAKEGESGTPAYRGLAYVVFERLPLANFGNRIPQLSFEIVNPVGRLERMVRAVTLIPGATEFGYEPATVVRVLGPGQSVPENRHIAHAPSNVVASLDELQAICPNLERVAIVVAWFGDDLRAQHCRLHPRVDNAVKETHGATWSVAGVTRAAAQVVSLVDDRPAFGGTPSDASVTNLIAELKARGLKVTFYPFVMMDIPESNTLPDPWSGEAQQPAYPWRGRITCDPAPGEPETSDGTTAAATQIDAFFSGGADAWNYRAMILHYANLAAAAGGIDAFLIGSELKSLTRVRSESGVYPAVAALSALATEVKTIVGEDCVVTYAADWTEYGAHVVDEAASEVRFPLDTLWSSPAIDAVGIDFYVPLADWRDDAGHLDRALTTSIHDAGYLAGNLTRGEAFDWFYADADARAVQDRTPITDGLGKPWTFRAKDIHGWWSNAHYERVDGVELEDPTAWTPQGKPIWLTEVSCAAIDKGANLPSVFPDPHSSEAGVPYFSNGRRDDLVQRRYIEAVIGAYDPVFGASEESNPLSAVYDGRMVDPSGTHLWTWDARPYPVFPASTDVWSDGSNWETGHWLTGRLGSSPLDGLVQSLLTDAGIEGCDTAGLGEGPDGYMVDRPMAPRAAIEPLAHIYAFDATEADGALCFRPRGGAPMMEITEDDLVLPPNAAPFRLVRGQETELPREVSLGFTDGNADFRRAAARSRRLVGGATRMSHAEIAAVMDDSEAVRRADIWLQDLWAGRETAEFALPPSRIALSPGDVISLHAGGRSRLMEVREIVDAESRMIKARAIDPEVFDLPLASPRRLAPTPPAALGPVHALVVDLPALDAEQPPAMMRLAVFADPWPGPIAVLGSSDGLSYQRVALALAPSIVGETLDDLRRGPTGLWQNTGMRVRLYGGALASVSDGLVLGGANVAAVRRADGAWEVLQFAAAELVGERTYALSRLLRGQAGSEWAMGDPLPAGSPFVMLDAQVIAVARGLDTLERPLQMRLVAAGRDHADPTAVALTATPQATALRPLAPVHLQARRGTEGVAFTWTRRTRLGGDGWAGEVPLGEDSEGYLLELLSGADVVRSVETLSPGYLYAAAHELADFATPQAAFDIRVSQLSATVGRGIAAAATLTL